MQQRDIVIVGAGILGAAVAYCLARQGLGERVTVVDRELPMSGSTSRAAALVTLLRDDMAQVALAQETLRAINRLEQQGDAVGCHRVGSVHVVPLEQHAAYAARVSACVSQGVRAEWVRAADIKAKAPWMTVAGDTHCVWVPDDCYVDGYQLGMAYLRNAQRLGVELRLGTNVVQICERAGQVCGVDTHAGARLHARHVVLAAGAWSNLLSVGVGVSLPMAPVRSQYWITGPLPVTVRDGAIVFLPAIRAYFRPELKGLLFGVRERRALAADSRKLPHALESFEFDPADPEGWEGLAQGYEALAGYWPDIATVPLAHYVSGPSNYTIDGQLLVGPSVRMPGLWLATGCNGSGITFSAGIGRVIADQIAGIEPPLVDTHHMQPERIGQMDPYAPAFLASCAATRSAKTTG